MSPVLFFAAPIISAAAVDSSVKSDGVLTSQVNRWPCAVLLGGSTGLPDCAAKGPVQYGSTTIGSAGVSHLDVTSRARCCHWRGQIRCFGRRRGKRMEFVDKILKCVDCGNDFVFTAGEQLFFFDKQFKNDPKRCKQCKARRVSGSGSARPETRTVCSECGTETTVPFKPTQGRPVLCRSCFQQKRTMSQAS